MKNSLLLLLVFIGISSATQLFAQEEEPIFVFTEQPPQFPGGDEERLRFLSQNLKYPELAKESDIQGVVYITFVVEVDGTISNVKVLRGIGGGCDEEAVRVIKLMPKWIPAKQRGTAVRSQFNMPIKFTLMGGKAIEKPKKERKSKRNEKPKLPRGSF